MNINPTALRNLYKPSMVIPNKLVQPREIEQTRVSSLSAEKTDRVSISSEGTQQKEVNRLVRSTLREVQQASSPERLESLRAQIQNNSYHVSTDALADRLMTRIFGE